MDSSVFNPIREHAGLAGFEVAETEDAFVVTFEKDGLNFRITVAHCVLEWFLDIEDPGAGLKFYEWADYTGYDSRPEEELALDMREHLLSLLEAIQNHPFRLVKKRTFLFSKVKCEWNIDGEWRNFDEGEVVK